MQLRLAAAGSGANALTALLLTHLHSDHIADLGDVIVTRWVTTFDPNPVPLQIIGPPGTADVVDAICKALSFDIGYRLAHHPDLTSPPAVEVHEYSEGVVWDRDGVVVHAAPTDHRPVAPTLGFRVEHADASVVLAGDTVPCSSLDALAAGAGALVHTVIRKELIETMPQQRIRDLCDYHSSVQEAAETATRADVGILILTHYVPGIPPGRVRRLAGAGRLGVQPPDRIGRRPAPGRGAPGRVGEAIGRRRRLTDRCAQHRSGRGMRRRTRPRRPSG